MCSSIDTLQNAVVAVVSRDLTDSKLDLRGARYAAICMAPIAILLAWYYADDAPSVFQIYLIFLIFLDLLLSYLSSFFQKKIMMQMKQKQQKV